MSVFCGGQFKYLVGVVLGISWGGAMFGGLSEVRQCLGRERRGREIEVELPLEHPRLFTLDARDWGGASTRTV